MELNDKTIDDSIIFKPINFENYSRLSSVELTKPVNYVKERKRSVLCRNVLLVITIVQFLVIVAICIVSGLFGAQVCQFLFDVSKDNATNRNASCLFNGMILLCWRYAKQTLLIIECFEKRAYFKIPFFQNFTSL